MLQVQHSRVYQPPTTGCWQRVVDAHKLGGKQEHYLINYLAKGNISNAYVF